MTLIYILISTSAISLLTLFGITIFSISHDRLKKSLLVLVALSAGAMFGNAMFHLLPEMVHLTKEGTLTFFGALLIATGAYFISFLFEQFFSWHHCHNTDHCEEKQAFGHLSLVSDAIHNTIDGIIIATSFIISPAFGFITTATIALHELPQELGDYAVLVHAGWSKKEALISNFLASTTVVLGGLLGYFLTQSIVLAVPVLVSFAMGSFLYIASSDLIPELKHQTDVKKIITHSSIFLLAVLMMVFSSLLG